MEKQKGSGVDHQIYVKQNVLGKPKAGLSVSQLLHEFDTSDNITEEWERLCDDSDPTTRSEGAEIHS